MGYMPESQLTSLFILMNHHTIRNLYNSFVKDNITHLARREMFPIGKLNTRIPTTIVSSKTKKFGQIRENIHNPNDFTQYESVWDTID